MKLLRSPQNRWVKIGLFVALPLGLLATMMEVISWRPQVMDDPSDTMGDVSSLAYSPDGGFLAGATGRRSNSGFTGIYLWDTRTRKAVKRFAHWRDSQSLAVAFAPDGKTLAGTGSYPKIRVFNTQSGKLQRTLKSPEHIVQYSSVALSFLPNSNLLAVGGMAGSLALWDAQNGKEMWAINWEQVAGGSIFALASSPDGKVLACACGHGIVQLRDSRTGRLLHTLKGFQKPVMAVAFSPDGQTLATGCGQPFSISGDSKLVKMLQNNPADNTVRFWDTKTWQLKTTLTGHAEGINSVAFSPDGSIVATGSEDKSIKLWDTQSGQLLRTLAGHRWAVTSVAFSPDGRTLASGSRDDTARIWRIR